MTINRGALRLHVLPGQASAGNNAVKWVFWLAKASPVSPCIVSTIHSYLGDDSGRKGFPHGIL